MNEWGINNDRQLSRDCADFYLLEKMVADDFKPAIRKLWTFERELTADLGDYLDVAIGGELRHTLEYDGLWEKYNDHICTATKEYLTRAQKLKCNRELCWHVWQELRLTRGSLHLLSDAELIFKDDVWRGNVGGAAWATAARALIDVMTRRIKPRTFVDRCWTLQHNGGAIFDKMYDVAGLYEVLELQAANKYAQLLPYASGDTKRMFVSFMRQQREEHDEIWLGR